KSVVRAYNGWLAEEYCAVDPRRLIGVGILPLTHDVQDTIGEIEYCAKAGLKTVLLQGFPSGLPYPSADDDRFWSAALDLNMPVSVHVDLDRSGDRARRAGVDDLSLGDQRRQRRIGREQAHGQQRRGAE